MNLPHKPKKSLFDSISNSQCQRHSISLPEDFHLVNVTEIYPQKRPWSAGWSVLLSLLASVNAWKLHLKLRGTQNTHNNDTEVVSWFCSIQIIKKKRHSKKSSWHIHHFFTISKILSLQSLWYYWNELQPFLSDEKQQLQTALAVSSVSAMCSLVPRSPWRLGGVGSAGQLPKAGDL